MGLIDNILNKGSNERSNCEAGNTNSWKPLRSNNFKEEISVDISSIINNNDIAYCSNNGVKLHHIPNMIRVEYKGELAKKGAQDVIAIIGYGDNNRWEDVEYFPMQKTAGNTFELLTFRKREGNVNIAFKDSANNWDNNSGQNYVFFEDTYGGSH